MTRPRTEGGRKKGPCGSINCATGCEGRERFGYACAPWEQAERQAKALIAAHRNAPKKKRGRPEAEIQAGIGAMLKAAGFAVYSTSQGYRPEGGGTRTTPGIPDLYAIHPHKGLAIWVEVKAPDGKLRPAQAQFLRLHAGCDWPEAHCWNSTAQCEEFLRRLGMIAA